MVLPTPPEAPVTSTGPPSGADAVHEQTVEREHGGESGDADDGGGPWWHVIGERHDPIGGDPGAAGEPAVVRHAQVVSLHQDPLSGVE